MSNSDWRIHLKTDPFYHAIAPSLLNSDDIHRYASLGCLIGDYDESRLLPAGYRMSFLADVIYWEPEKKSLKRIEKSIGKDDEFTLPRNSIVYLHMREEFRMPQYIAARFNLRITHVHQGLLLGTGPLIDPGFEGRIMVPLHNLTDNDYLLIGGQSIIHVEFTKLSMLKRWRKGEDPETYDDKYVPFQEDKIRSTPNEYFRKAQVGAKGGVISNLESALAESRSLNEKTQNTLRQFQRFGVIAAVALILGAFTLVQSTNNILGRVYDTASEARATVVDAMALLRESSATLGSTEQQSPTVDTVDPASGVGQAQIQQESVSEPEAQDDTEQTINPAPVQQ